MVIKAPQPLDENVETMFKVFLAGSIEMGKADNWQSKVEEAFGSRQDIALLNPRRDDWDNSWVQDINNPQFNQQVNWELNAMEAADLIIMYFLPGTHSPITLLEFGLHATSGKLVVCCPEGFWRKGNIDIVCKKYDVPQAIDVEGLMDTIHLKVKSK
jgi:hypothetical protein